MKAINLRSLTVPMFEPAWDLLVVYYLITTKQNFVGDSHACFLSPTDAFVQNVIQGHIDCKKISSKHSFNCTSKNCWTHSPLPFVSLPRNVYFLFGKSGYSGILLSEPYVDNVELFLGVEESYCILFLYCFQFGAL